MMSKVPHTREELEAHLRDQMEFLRASCSAYDAGFRGEAKRLAVVVRILVHDTDSSRSLLSQLELKQIPFCDTSNDYDPGKYFVSFHGLALMKISTESGGEFVPRCSVPPKPPPWEPMKWVCFGEWWDKLVIVDSQGNQFSRRRLVRILSNQVGGAHVDPQLDGTYAALTRDHSMAIAYETGDKSGDLVGVELASMRQIAHEMLMSVEKSCPQFVG